MTKAQHFNRIKKKNGRNLASIQRSIQQTAGIPNQLTKGLGDKFTPNKQIRGSFSQSLMVSLLGGLLVVRDCLLLRSSISVFPFFLFVRLPLGFSESRALDPQKWIDHPS